MAKLLLASLLVATVSARQWFGAYNLNEAEKLNLTESSCYHGSYGSDGRFSLLSCQYAGAKKVASLADDVHLCVLELGHSMHLPNVHAALKKDAQAQVLFEGETELVIAAPNTPGVASESCSPVVFEPGHVLNAAFVPVAAFVPQAPMPTHHRAVQRSVLKSLAMEPDPIIVGLMNQYSQDRTREFLRQISQDGNSANTLITRNSYAIAVGRAGCANTNWLCAHTQVQYIVDELNTMFAQYPGEVTVETNSFRADMCSNVVLKINGENEPNQIIVAGAHLDSRNTGSGPTATGPAPGADDNGTGSAVLLEMARVIAANNVEFHYSVHFLWFCGEEQGLLGSAALANNYRSTGATIIGMFNNDMIGYTSPAHGVTLSFMNRNATPWLSQSCKEFSSLYIPTLRVGDTSACCSDQQSFFSRGFPAAGIFETPTASVVYPQYHRPGDSFDNGLVNHEQVWNFGRANFVCTLEYAIPLSRS